MMKTRMLDMAQALELCSKSPGKRLFSATTQEIMSGLTSDIYFFRTMEILKAAGTESVPVTMEIFTSRPGVFAGIEEVKILLSGKNVTVHALPEGENMNEKEVVIRLEGPYCEFGLYETGILGILASSSAWATAARECKDMAGDIPVICFGSRHIHPAVAPVMERAAFIGGCDGVSNVLAAHLLETKPAGTMPHAMILILGDTVKAAKLYHEVMPGDTSRIVLVDTLKDEAEETLRVAEALQKNLDGVRLDTPAERGGVTPDLVREVRARLDLAGFEHVKIFVSGGIRPERIPILVEAGAEGFGVGSYISDAPPIDMTMDIKEVMGKPLAKRGRIPGKTDNPRLIKMNLS
ncbi:MAG: nicotinate phosphoribosyltransferase [Candidatus Eremiobacteraeota bacterium]|nr:nicotinate phosphoribosyltransferase [Candidatus Eremiobacteraeota bacterium]